MTKTLPVLISVGLIILWILAFPTNAQSAMDIFVFTQQGCSHCAKILSFLDTMKSSEFPEIAVHEFDLKQEPKYFALFQDFATAYGTTTAAVPTTFIGAKFVVGDNENELRNALEFYKVPVHDYKNPELFVKEKLAELGKQPAPVQPQSKTEKIIGWIFISAIVIGAGTFVFKKMR